MPPPRPDPVPGVYTDLPELLRLEHKARGFSFLPRQPVHSVLTGRHASRLRGRGLNFEEIRRYQPGDDVRTIDWKVTARTRRPHTRVFTEERDRPVLLVVDQRLTMFFGSRGTTKAVTAARATALAAWRVLAAGDRVGAVVFGDGATTTTVVKPHRSRRQVLSILQAVVEHNRALGVGRGVESDPGALDRALERADRLAVHDHLVCVISDGAGAGDGTARWLTRLGRHNDVLLGFVYDPLEAELPASGRWAVTEGSRSLEVDTGDAKLRRRYAEAFEERRHRMERLSRLRTIPLIALRTGAGVAEQIRDRLGYRPGSPRGPR